MRRRHITSHKKLPILILLIISSASLAKDKIKDTNIICFAAKNQWVCAPEDKQHIANTKASKLINKSESELETSEVVIKTLNAPKFNNSGSYKNKTSPIAPIKQELPKTIKTPQDNPYANLWSHQLIGVSTPQNAINFVKQKNLNKNDVLIVKSSRNDLDWWIVLYGLYKDKDTGLQNNNLPQTIEKPWLRPLKNLQFNGFIEKY